MLSSLYGYWDCGGGGGELLSVDGDLKLFLSLLGFLSLNVLYGDEYFGLLLFGDEEENVGSSFRNEFDHDDDARGPRRLF